MTGEVSLRGERHDRDRGAEGEAAGRAARGHQDSCCIPEENVKDLQEIPENVKNGLEIIPVKWIDQVLDIALESKPTPLPETVAAAVAPESGAVGRRCRYRVCQALSEHSMRLAASAEK
jgi:ATP-dependent Lon protease